MALKDDSDNEAVRSRGQDLVSTQGSTKSRKPIPTLFFKDPNRKGGFYINPATKVKGKKRVLIFGAEIAPFLFFFLFVGVCLRFLFSCVPLAFKNN